MSSLGIRLIAVRLPNSPFQGASRSLGRVLAGPKSVNEAAMRLVVAVSAFFVKA